MTDIFELLTQQSAVQKEIKAIVDETRAKAIAQLKPGERQPAEWGSVSLDAGKPKAVLVDEDRLAGFLVEEHEFSEGDSGVELRHVLDDTKVDEVLAVVAEHAPHLIRTVIHVKEYAIAAALRRAEKGESIPGVSVTKGADRLVVRTTPEAKDRVRAVLSGGLQHIALEGGV